MNDISWIYLVPSLRTQMTTSPCWRFLQAVSKYFYDEFGSSSGDPNLFMSLILVYDMHCILPFDDNIFISTLISN